MIIPKRAHRGFTLTELMIVLGLIAFLMLLVFLLTRRFLQRGNDARRKGDVKTIQVAVEEYEKDKDCYPLPQLVTCDPGDGLLPYMNKIPCDPTTGSSYFYDYEDASCPKWYRIYVALENELDEDASVSCGPNGAYNYYASSPNAPACNLSESAFFGCKAGICVPILWDSNRPGPECDPNSRSPNCDGVCGPPATECKPWNQ